MQVERSSSGGTGPLALSPHPCFSSQSGLYAISGSSPSDVWAVGYRQIGAGFATLAMHFDGPVWRTVPTPNPPGHGDDVGELHGVVALSPEDAWAVGVGAVFGDGAPLVEHWDGLSWTMVQTPRDPTPRNDLSSVLAVAPNDVWAFGTAFHDINTGGPLQALILHWDGQRWSKIPSAPATRNPDLGASAAGSSTAVWVLRADFAQAKGASFGGESLLLERWDGRAWERLPAPDAEPGAVNLRGIAALPDGTVWLAGTRREEVVIERTCLGPV